MSLYGHAEFPASSYDKWKTTPPDFYADVDERECDHEEFDYDILTGRAFCNYCDHQWWLTEAQLKAMESAVLEYDRMMRRERRWWRIAWRTLADWLVSFRVDSDEVPF